MSRFAYFAVMAVAILISGCATRRPPQDMTAFNAAAPRSILVVPVVNKSLDVDAPNYLLATLAVPLAERGYYVFPVNTTKIVLEQEGLYEGDAIHAQPAADLAKLFGADAVLYVTINRWDAQYVLLSTIVTVDFSYRIVHKDGNTIWKSNQRMQYQPQQANTGNPIANLIAAAVTAALARAKPNYMPLARQANGIVFVTGPDAIPRGPYGPEVVH